MNTLNPKKQANQARRHLKQPSSPPTENSDTALHHLAVLGGLGLLAHCTELGEHLAEGKQTTESQPMVRALDPRDRVNPRKRFIPR